MKALIASSHQPRYHMLKTTPRESTSKKRTSRGCRNSFTGPNTSAAPFRTLWGPKTVPKRCPVGKGGIGRSCQRFQNGDALHMMSHREGVKGSQGPYAVARVPGIGNVTRQRSRVTRDVGDRPRAQGRDLLDDRLPGARARWVKNHQVCMDPLSYQWFQHTVDLAAT